MNGTCNITQIVERQRLGYSVRKQVDIAYARLKCTVEDVEYFESLLGNSNCPVFVCKFCHVKNYEHFVAAANEDGKISIRNTQSKKDQLLTCFQAHDNAIFDVAWTNFDTQLITASGDHSSTLWQLREATVSPLLLFHGHKHSVKTIACRPNDKYVYATGARDGHLLIWDTRHVPSPVIRSPDVSIYHAHEEPAFFKYKKGSQTNNSITSLVYQDDNTLISCSAGNGLPLHPTCLLVESSITILVANLEPPQLCNSMKRLNIKIWDMRKSYSIGRRLPQAKYILPYPGTSGRNGFSSIAISPCGFRLYGNCIDNNLYCYNIGTYSEQPVAIYTGHSVSSFYIKNCVSPDGKYIASGSNDGKAFIWPVSDPSKPLVSLSGHNAEVTGIDWCKAAGEPKMISCSDDATYRIWRINPAEVDAYDTNLRGCAELYKDKRLTPEKRLLKRKIYCNRPPELITRPGAPRSPVNAQEAHINKKQCSIDITANLPNYVVDGISPHVHRCRPAPKVNKNWLNRLQEKSINIDSKSHEQLSPNRNKPTSRKSTTSQVGILRFFKVSTRPTSGCEQTSPVSESKPVPRTLNSS